MFAIWRETRICGNPGCVPIVFGARPLNSMTYALQQYLSVPIVCALAPLIAGSLDGARARPRAAGTQEGLVRSFVAPAERAA